MSKTKPSKRPSIKSSPVRAKTKQTVAKKYRCKVYLIPEADGGFSVLAANLPGAASQGETDDEALKNIIEALEGVIASYKEAKVEIPWSERARQVEDPNTKIRWVVVHG
jgi:predicted RNase H-like HicB family nuclease